MHQRRSSRVTAMLLAVAFAASAPLSALAQQAAPRAAAAKRPLTYDTYDYWKNVAGTELSRDGDWLAYALTSEAEDSELIVINLKTKQQFKQARGTEPSFTPDGKFVVFTMPAPKEEVEKARKANTRDEDLPKPGAGMMSLPDGKVTTFDKIGTVRLPAESSAWVALQRPRANAGAGRAGRQ
nr:hypothetical protein [Acidobacteriota bacterium]